MTTVDASIADKATVFLLRANFLMGMTAAVLGLGLTAYAGITRTLPIVGIALVAVIYAGWRLDSSGVSAGPG